MILFHIFLANLLSRALALALAATLAFRWLKDFAQSMSYMACGMLLGLALFHLVPEAFETGIGFKEFLTTVAATLLFLILFTRLSARYGLHTHALPRVKRLPVLLGGGLRYEVDCCAFGMESATPLLLGSAMHNFVDGILVAAAFMSDSWTGCMVTFAIFAHEVPQLLGQLVILTRLGLTHRRSMSACALVACAAILGGFAGGLLFVRSETLIPFAMSVSATSFVFVSYQVLRPVFGFGFGKRALGRIAFFVLSGVLFSILLQQLFYI